MKTKCWVCVNDYVDNDVKERDLCHFTGKYRGSAHRDCNINVKLNCNIPVLFHNQNKYHSHLIMQVLGKFNLKINVRSNGLEKYVSFTINNKFFDSFQFLSFSLDPLVKNSSKDDFRNLSQEFDNNVLALKLLDLTLSKKGFYTYEYMSDFEKFQEELPSNEKFLKKIVP